MRRMLGRCVPSDYWIDLVHWMCRRLLPDDDGGLKSRELRELQRGNVSAIDRQHNLPQLPRWHGIGGLGRLKLSELRKLRCRHLRSTFWCNRLRQLRCRQLPSKRRRNFVLGVPPRQLLHFFGAVSCVWAMPRWFVRGGLSNNVLCLWQQLLFGSSC